MPIPTYTVSIRGHECTVPAATPEDAARAGVRRLWDQITPPFDWDIDVTDGTSKWPYQVFARNFDGDRNGWAIVVGP